MTVEVGGYFKLTLKTRLFLWLYRRFNWFDRIPQWLINHCDVYPDSYDPYSWITEFGHAKQEVTE